jgi:uncharacterized lipoprotein YmbA
MRPVTLLFVAVLAATVATASCIGTPAPARTLFVLPTSSPGGTPPHAGALGVRSLGLGPVSVASHLDQEYVAVRLENTRYEYADSMRWASPVAVLVAERLAEGLVWATGIREVRAFPWPASRAPTVRVTARLVRFELTPGGTADITAYWSILDGGTGDQVNSGYFEHREPLQGTSGAAGVEALDRALLRFANYLAGELEG